MGLNNNQSNNINKIYLNIVGGKITRRYKEHQPEENGKPVTFSREIKDKNTGEVIKTVIERSYDSISGLVQSAEIDASGSFGAMLVFKIIDGEEYTLSVPLDSSYGIAIMKKVPNLDSSAEITFSPFNFESKDQIKNGEPKKIVGCNLFQNGEKIMPAWTQEKPGSLPQWKQSETTGKWDNTDFLEFLGGHFKQWASKIGGVPTDDNVNQLAEAMGAENPMEMEQEFAQRKAAESETPPPTSENNTPIDDLPFG